jgi:phenylpropionate dioxygenase-like ring-hydroxylating dioxygenase large terminal subunit
VLDNYFNGKEVHKALFLDPSIFEQERRKIFAASWCYLGHESLIPQTGDFFTGTIAGQPLAMVRQKNGEIVVLHNRCPHKGVKVLAEPRGNVGRFIRCPYHAWTFKTDGQLLSIPVKKEYDDCDLDSCTAHKGMRPVAATENYRGFVFVRLTENGVGFTEFFGESLSTLDNMVMRSPLGQLRAIGQPLLHRHRCNWKMVVDNQTDTCHPMVAHESSAGEAIRLWKETGNTGTPPMAVELFSPFMASYDFFSAMGIRTWPNGHGHTGVSNSIHKAYSSIPGYWELMVQSYGETQAAAILDDTRHNTVYFPNLMVKGPIQTLRVIRPVSATETVVESWIFELAGAPEQLLERTVQYNNLINSPCSMVAHDDVEMYERATEGLRSQANDWVNVARLYEPGESHEQTQVVSGTSERAMRNFYNTWQHLMQDHDGVSAHE